VASQTYRSSVIDLQNDTNIPAAALYDPGRGSTLRAYDKMTGQELASVFLPAGATGSPMTYMLNGKQYIALAISGIGFGGELIAFSLPA